MFRTALVLTLLCAAAPAASLPTLEGETLGGAKVTMPSLVKGKTALLVMGFTKDSQKQTEAWARRLRADFPALDVWSAADLEDAPRLIRPMILRAMRSSIPKQQHDHFFIMTKGGKTLRGALAYDGRSPRNDDAYLVLIDPAGNLTWQFHGAVSEVEIAALRKHLP